MGAVKDLVDLVTQLTDSIEDRKFAAELRNVQSMIGNIQSEHAAIHEQRIDLLTENAELKQTIASLNQEIADLRNEIIEVKNQKPAVGNSLDEEAEKILMLLAQRPDITSQQIAHSVSLDLTRTEYWLGVLEDDKMIYGSYSMMSPTQYYIAQNGREYLVKNNKI